MRNVAPQLHALLSSSSLPPDLEVAGSSYGTLEPASHKSGPLRACFAGRSVSSQPASSTSSSPVASTLFEWRSRTFISAPCRYSVLNSPASLHPSA